MRIGGGEEDKGKKRWEKEKYRRAKIMVLFLDLHGFFQLTFTHGYGGQRLKSVENGKRPAKLHYFKGCPMEHSIK